jgi:hypothetical protein
MVLNEQCILALNKLAMKKFLVLFVFGLLAMPVMSQSRFKDEKEEDSAKTIQNDTQTSKPSPKARNQASFWDRTRFGGNLGLGFSNGFSYINVSPRMYYLATEKLWLGAGLTFIWTKYNYYQPPFDEQFVYGLNLSAQYMLFGPIFIQAEYEPLSFERYVIDNNDQVIGEERTWVHGILLGGGISQRMGRGMFFASVLYNVTWSNEINSYYNSPWIIRFGFGI